MPKWRKMTWLFVIVQVLFIVWIITGLAAVADECAGLRGTDLDFCEAGVAIGASLGVGVIVGFWVMVDIILGVAWLVTNRATTRECPRCGVDVKKGLVICPACDFDWSSTTARAED